MALHLLVCCFGSGRDAGQSDEMEDIHSAKRNVDANGDMVKRVDAKKLIRYSKLYDMHQWLFFFFFLFFKSSSALQWAALSPSSSSDVL